jgi:hypothetical protein
MIFQGQAAHARNWTMNCPRRMLRKEGNNMAESAPKDIIFAAMFVPRIWTNHAKAQRKTANLVFEDQYSSRIRLIISH